MKTYELECVGCSVRFTAKSPRAKWHSPACRKAAQRAGRVDQVAELDPAPPADVEKHGLVETTRRELTDAGVIESFHAQLALQLARRLADPDESAPSSLSRELDRVMTAALGARTVPAAEPTGEAGPDDDELTRAREAREHKARAAAGRA